MSFEAWVEECTSSRPRCASRGQGPSRIETVPPGSAAARRGELMCRAPLRRCMQCEQRLVRSLRSLPALFENSICRQSAAGFSPLIRAPLQRPDPTQIPSSDVGRIGASQWHPCPDDFVLEPAGLLNDQRIERVKKRRIEPVCGRKVGSALLDDADALGLHHRYVVDLLVSADAHAAVQSLPQRLQQCAIGLIELPAKVLQGVQRRTRRSASMEPGAFS